MNTSSRHALLIIAPLVFVGTKQSGADSSSQLSPMVVVGSRQVQQSVADFLLDYIERTDRRRSWRFNPPSRRGLGAGKQVIIDGLGRVRPGAVVATTDGDTRGRPASPSFKGRVWL